MSTPRTAASSASSVRRAPISDPEMSSSTVVTGYRDNRRIRSMLAPCAAMRALTAATALASRGAPRTTTAALRRELALEAAVRGVDIAVSPAGLARRGQRLVVMDVDSTLIQD